MNIGTLIKQKIKERHLTQAELAEMAGFKNQSNIAMILRTENSMRIDKLQNMLDALNCELVVRDKITGEEIVITPPDID